jgi:hypothetical protein
VSLVAAWPARAYVCTAIPGSTATVQWETREVGFVVHQRCSQDVEPAACLQAVRISYQHWTDVACSDFTFLDQGVTADGRAGYNWRDPGDNRNVVVWREGNPDDPVDGWPHQRGALAITTVTFNSRSGKILDADIELNGAPGASREFRFAACPPPPASCTDIDVENTVTHEVGHVVGLDHPLPGTPGAADTTMFASAPPGETKKRSLAQDDVDGICAIYPAGRPTTPCVVTPDPGRTPRFKQVRTCDDTPQSPCTAGCPVGLPHAPGLMVGLWLLRRRPRRPA